MPVDNLSLPTLDTRILEMASGDCAFLIEVCDSFLADAPARVEAVKAAIAADRPSVLRDAAHAMKSLSGCVGAMSLLNVCRQMETAGKSNNIELAQEMIEQLRTEYENAQMAIQDYKTTLQVDSDTAQY